MQDVSCDNESDDDDDDDDAPNAQGDNESNLI
jgi:hypothetical protein